eukprot:244129-Lingulodinium_polyedra.AAC.1
MRELEGLFAQDVFYDGVRPDDIQSNGRIIDSKMVRKEKGNGIKSRLVLRDCRGMTQYSPEELYAATPADSAMRLMLAL